MARVVALSAVLVIAASPLVIAQNEASIWTQLANTGIVDEEDASIYQFHDTGSAAIKSGVASGTLNIRFSIAANGNYGYQGPATEDPDRWEGPTPCVRLNASLRDPGAGARVVVALKRLDLASGDIRTLGRIDSDIENLPSTEYIFYSKCLNIPVDFPFDFRFFAYFIDAQLIKTATSGNPGLKVVQLCGALKCEEF